MKDKYTLRVAIGTPEALQSSIWRFWTQKNEVYIAARELARLLKLSLHSSGIWRLAYVSVNKINDQLIEDNDPRVMSRWKKPNEFKPGWTQCLDVIIPTVSLRKHFSLDKVDNPKGNIHWIAKLSNGYKQQITLLFADSSSRCLEEVTQDGDQVLGRFDLEDGRVAWIITRQSKMTEVEQEYVEKYAADMKINYESDPGDHVFAAMMLIDRDQKYPIISNFSLGWENVYIGESQKK